jgi:hypothetical protein
MNCQKFENVVGELARGQMMEADVRGEALAHSTDCSDCALRLRDEETLTHGLRSLASEMSSLEAPESLELRLRQAFRERGVPAPSFGARDRRRYWLAAVAAVLLIVFSVVAVRWRAERVQQPVPQIANVPETRKDNVVAVKNLNPPVPERQLDEPKQKVRPKPRHNTNSSALQARVRDDRRKANNVVANHVTSEIATEFMPLGYLNPVSLQDGGQIVRVELPRSALASFGLPVNMDRYNERVKADVLLGVDGLAHAIRFVQ